MPRNVLKTNLRRIDRLLKHIPFVPWQKRLSNGACFVMLCQEGMSLHIQSQSSVQLQSFLRGFRSKRSTATTDFPWPCWRFQAKGFRHFHEGPGGEQKKTPGEGLEQFWGSPSGCLEGENNCVSSLRTLSYHWKGFEPWTLCWDVSFIWKLHKHTNRRLQHAT